jgi:hypothetical protein
MGKVKQGQIAKNITCEKQGISPEQAIGILRKNGIYVDEKEAKKILDLLYFLGKLTVNQFINNESI